MPTFVRPLQPQNRPALGARSRNMPRRSKDVSESVLLKRCPVRLVSGCNPASGIDRSSKCRPPLSEIRRPGDLAVAGGQIVDALLFAHRAAAGALAWSPDARLAQDRNFLPR